MGTTKTVLCFMGEDHDRLDSLFREFRNIKNTDKNKARDLFQEFRTGLQKHIGWEEEILFPLFENKTGMHDAGPTAVMRMEHRKIKDVLDRIHHDLCKNIQTKNLEDGLIEVLNEHNHKEESVLYPSIDNSVSEEEKERIFTMIKNVPSEESNKGDS